MKSFNINENIYFQITEWGWIHLRQTVGQEYIDVCITPTRVEIDGVDYYQLQCWQVFHLMPPSNTSKVLFKPTILIKDNDLKNFEGEITLLDD